MRQNRNFSTTRNFQHRKFQ